MRSLGRNLLVLILVALAVTGCTPSLSPDTYTTSGAGKVNRVVAGVVVSSRVVQVSDDANAGDGGKTGMIAGGIAGAIAGSALGGGRGSALTAVGGAVAGGVLGNVAQKGLTKQTGVEYVIKTKDGSLISVVQGPTPTFQRGQHVLVEYGRRARVIADPSY